MTVIGDLVDDAGAARAAEVRCVLFDGGSQSRELLERQGVPVVDSLLEAASLAVSPKS
jgi:phosphoglycolate phosphatase-like HAD superfamily hydrolase